MDYVLNREDVMILIRTDCQFCDGDQLLLNSNEFVHVREFYLSGWICIDCGGAIMIRMNEDSFNIFLDTVGDELFETTEVH